MDIQLRLWGFFSVVCILMFWESHYPRKTQMTPRLQRWPNNFTLGLINVLCVQATLMGIGLLTAQWVQLQGWGLLQLVHWPAGIEMLCSLLGLDLLIYVQHRLFHQWPWLWRWHRVHHTDLALDVSSGVRFHPVEAIISLGLKQLGIVVLGVSPMNVLIFELSLSLLALFNHSNIYIPEPLENSLRKVLITPDLHRIHHSVIREEQQKNFGFSVPWWDQCFGSFQAKAQLPADQIILGDGILDTPAQTQSLKALLKDIPLRSQERFHP